MDLSVREKKVRVLCIDGGGYLGLAAASFLRTVEAHFGTTCHQSFDLFVGTSTGGLIALSLASGMSGPEVEDLYRSLGKRIFPAQGPLARAARLLRSVFWAKYDNRALKEALEQAFGDKTFKDLRSLGKAVAIPALSAATGTPRIFKTDHGPKLTRDASVRLVDAALATSAAPTYFPPARIRHARDGAADFYVDGGVFANNPTLIGLVEAIAYLDVEPARLEILSVSTPRPDARMPRGRFPWGGGILGWALLLPRLFVNSPSQLVDRAMAELTKKLKIRYSRVVLQQPPKPLPFDLASSDATEKLVSIGVNEASRNELRDELSFFFKKERTSDG